MVVKKERVTIEGRLIADVNRKAKAFTTKSYQKKQAAFERKLQVKEISIEKKKSILMKEIHYLIVDAFSFDPKQITAKKEFRKHIGNKLIALRLYVDKLRDINYFLKNVLLADIGLIKKKQTTTLPTSDITFLIFC